MNIKLRFQDRRRWYQLLFEADRHRRTGCHVPLAGREPLAAVLPLPAKVPDD